MGTGGDVAEVLVEIVGVLVIKACVVATDKQLQVGVGALVEPDTPEVGEEVCGTAEGELEGAWSDITSCDGQAAETHGMKFKAMLRLNLSGKNRMR